MNPFIEEYIAKLKMLTSENDVKVLYRWFWDHQEEVARTARQINLQLGLEGEVKLQPDLPCFIIGGSKGLLILSANPGWDQELNALEDPGVADRRISPQAVRPLAVGSCWPCHPAAVEWRRLGLQGLSGGTNASS